MNQSLENIIRERIDLRIKKLREGVPTGDFNNIDAVAELIRNANDIVVLTGAGISTMSGIPDYRSALEGVWKRKPDLLHSLYEITFLSNPEEFWNSYYELFTMTLAEIIPELTNEAVIAAVELIEPNEGHRFFAKLEVAGKRITIVTQNVDGLAQRAGNKQVIEIHGNMTTCTCPNCENTYQLKEIFDLSSVPQCECGMVLRPDVVFFGDAVKDYDKAREMIIQSELAIVTGTSLNVAPFNLLPAWAASRRIPVVYINGDVSLDDEQSFDFTIEGNISEICTILGGMV